MQKSLGMLEIISIPIGIEAGDAMLKAAEVELVTAQPVCAGKYIVIVVGDVAAVNAAIKAGAAIAGTKMIDSLSIANIHEQVPKAINGCTEAHEVFAIGAMETFSLCAAILAADEAVKTANINLLEIRLGRGLGGKSFVTLSGEVAAVKEAVTAASKKKEVQGLISDSVVIPAPHPEIAKTLF